MLSDAFQGLDQEAGVNVWEAEFIDTATTATDPLRVKVRGYDNGEGAFGPVAWLPHPDNSFPQAGDRALVAQADTGTWWVLQWGADAGPETMRFVGTAGQPAFSSGWGNSGGTVAPVGFYRDRGRVYLQGSATKTSGAPSSGAIFTLPDGYRPTGRLVYPRSGGTANDAFGATRVDVLANGEVHWISGGTTEVDFTTLDGIHFRHT